MAWQTSKRVWDHTKEIKESDKVMLLALADKADESGICWPKFDTSYETLSSMVGVNRRSAIRIVEKLEEWGHVYVDEHAVGRGNSNLFLVASGLSLTEIESLLINHFGKGPDEATLCAAHLLKKQDAHIKGVTGNTKSFPGKGKKGIDDSAKGVIPNTISEQEKGVTGEQKVLPVTQKGVMDNTQPIIPTNQTPNGVVGKPTTRTKRVRAPDEQPGPKTIVKDKFLELTGLQMPGLKTDANFWWAQFGEILRIVKDDTQQAIKIMTQVVKYMQREQLPISGPKSIVNLCRTVAAGQSLNGAVPSEEPKEKLVFTDKATGERITR